MLVGWGGAPGPATAETFLALPDGKITRDLGDGTGVTVSLTGESAKLNPGLVAGRRNLWVSGRGGVEVTGRDAATAATKIYPGYVVACQADIDALSTVGNSATSLAGMAPTDAPDRSRMITLASGRTIARYLLDIRPREQSSVPGRVYHQVFGRQGSVTWTDEPFSIDGCNGGTARARSFVRVDISTARAESRVTLWGEPFNIG
ncbi:MspA family porin [Nocardia sp. XZ_19_385]|uniref:MspA family porin n=1 Tax=Nocardia sp. XZ_19_385 TaxID=2769488 RepID=UPI00188FDE1A|nr:MspA family porin [Nocardia sp. XZ_19_385]